VVAASTASAAAAAFCCTGRVATAVAGPGDCRRRGSKWTGDGW
jgi:hypothetical protein